eukprot:scaffold34516_cov72-Phaeocystis_antarctica.AAC.2
MVVRARLRRASAVLPTHAPAERHGVAANAATRVSGISSRVGNFYSICRWAHCSLHTAELTSELR